MLRLIAGLRLILLLCLLRVPGPARAGGPFDPFGEATIAERPGAQVPLDLPLRDSTGRRTTLRALAHGRPIVLAPVLHNCPTLCGVTLAGLVSAIAARPAGSGRDFLVAAFGIDPKETPPDAAGDLQRLRIHAAGAALPETVALTGSERSIRAVTDALGYRYAWDERIGQYAHVAAVAVLTPDGRLARWLYGLSPTAGELAGALDDARAGRTGTWVEQLILLCYHYDPVTGRYTPVIENIIRLAALGTVAALGIFLLLMWCGRRA